jgi:hypothetical protein
LGTIFNFVQGVRNLMSSKAQALVRTANVLVFLMAALQLAYGLYAYVSPAAFSVIRGTELFVIQDADWVRIYASRTLFIALLIGYLLYAQQYRVLAVASLLGTIMPITDAVLAYQASATNGVVFKHVATALFLAVTFAVLYVVARRGDVAQPALQADGHASAALRRGRGLS